MHNWFYTQPGQKLTVNRVVSYGCSYTAGSEFLDHEIVKDSEKIKRKRGPSVMWNLMVERLPPDKIQEMDQRQQRMAWAGQIADHMQVEFVGRARGGTGLPQSLWQIQQDHAQGLITREDLVLVGATTVERAFAFNHLGMRTWQLGWPEGWPGQRWCRDTVLSVMSYEVMLWNYLGYLMQIAQLSSEIQGRIRVYGMIDWRELIKPLKQHRPWFDAALSRARLRPEICMDHGIYDFVRNDQECHAGLHPRVIVHERYAHWCLKHLQRRAA